MRSQSRLKPCFIATVVLALAVAGAGDHVRAQPSDIEILSKADAIQLFGMSRRQWEKNVEGAVRAGAVTATPPSTTGMVGMTIRTADGLVSTRLDYSRGDARPTSIHVVVTHLPHQHRGVFTDALAQELIATARAQLAPEFELTGDMERVQGSVVFLYIITEKLVPGAGR
jgi:hypothetical protein